MKTKVIIVIAVVAIVAAASVAAVVLINNEKSKPNREYAGGTVGCLQVYGNANNDYYIDDSDVKLIKKIIDENIAWEKDYPFADADCNGKIDENDVTKTESLRDATVENRAKANFVCYSTDFPKGYIEKDVIVPCTSAGFNYAATSLAALIVVGVHDELTACTCTKSQAEGIEPVFANVYKDKLVNGVGTIGDGNAKVDVSLVANYVKDKSDTEKMTCYIFSNKNSYDYYNVRTGLTGLGVSALTISDGTADPMEYASCMLALGFLFGTSDNGYKEKAADIAEWLWDYNEYYKSIIEKTNADGFVKKKCVVTSYSTGKMAGATSGNTQNLKLIGLEPVLNDSSKYPGSPSYNYETDDWLNKLDIDFCIFLSSAIWAIFSIISRLFTM